MRILVTGGGGYLGATLVPVLLAAGHTVRVVDSLVGQARTVQPLAARLGLEFVVDDIRVPSVARTAMRGQDAVVHLAALVGYPACDADRAAAVGTNVGGTRNVVAYLAGRPLIFASTCSVYGRARQVCDEETIPAPLTLYGKTKLEAEAIVRDAAGVVLRFATLYGVSPRLRLDLLINNFVSEAVRRGRLSIYQPHFRRTFLHVRDAARACLTALEHHDADTTFVVADERTSMTKLEVARRVRRQVPFDLHLTGVGTDHDHRDYEVSGARFGALGFRPESVLDQGIAELIGAVRTMTTGGTMAAMP